MNNKGIITFPGRERGSFRGLQDDSAVPPPAATPVIEPLEQSTRNGSKETPAESDEVLVEQLAYFDSLCGSGTGSLRAGQGHLAGDLQLSGYRETKMLRITVQDDGTLWRLQLSGRLAGIWVAETENMWRSAPVSDGRVEIDLTEVTWIDQAGWRLLRAMNQAGASFIAKGVAMEALVEDITGKPARRGRPE